MVRRRPRWAWWCCGLVLLVGLAAHLGSGLFVNSPARRASGDDAVRSESPAAGAQQRGAASGPLAVRPAARARGQAFHVTRAEAYSHAAFSARREGGGGDAHRHTSALALDGAGPAPRPSLSFSYWGARTRFCFENLTDTPLEPRRRFDLFGVLDGAAFGSQCAFANDFELQWGDAACGARDDVLAHFVYPVDGFPRLTLSGSLVPRPSPSSGDSGEVSLVVWHLVQAEDESLAGARTLDSGAFSVRGGSLLHGRASLPPAGVRVENFAGRSVVGLIVRHAARAPAAPGAASAAGGRLRLADAIELRFASAASEAEEDPAGREAAASGSRSSDPAAPEAPPWAPPAPVGPGMAPGYFDPKRPSLVRACDAARYKSRGVTRDSFAKLFEGYTVWSMDLHAAPIMCSAEVYEHMGMRVDAQIDSVTCRHYRGRRVCGEDLKVFSMNDGAGVGIDVCPHRLRREFFDAYKEDPRMQRARPYPPRFPPSNTLTLYPQADVFVCSHPAANCELFLPFNRSMVVYATTRLEFGRHDDNIDWRWRYEADEETADERWRHWVASLRRIAADPRNTVAANSLFDALYIRHHTGIPATYIPSWCGYTAREAAERPRAPRAEIVVVPNRINTLGHVPGERWRHPLFSSLDRWMRRHQSRTGRLHDIRFLNELYPRGYEFADLASHPAMVAIPYQLSLMSFFEYYRVGVPMFFPSIALLTQWETDYGLTWERVYGHPEPQAAPFTPYDPNAASCEDFVYWLQYADFYRWPHLTYFDSWEHLLHLLDTADLPAISAAMRAENECVELQILESWRDVMSRAFGKDPPGSRQVPSSNFCLRLPIPREFYQALREQGYERPPIDSNPDCWPDS